MYGIFDSLKKWTPTIFSFLGAAGVVVTGIFAAKAVPKAVELISSAEQDKSEPLTMFEEIQVAAPAYIPTGIVALSSILCILGANYISNQQITKLAGTMLVGGYAYKQYKDKVVSIFGKEADQTVEAAISLEEDSEEEYSWDEKRLFFEENRSEFFESTLTNVYLAAYHLNRNFAIRGHAKLNEFYEFLDISKTEKGEVLGWSKEMAETDFGYFFIDIFCKKCTTDDGLECMCITMPMPPVEDYLED